MHLRYIPICFALLLLTGCAGTSAFQRDAPSVAGRLLAEIDQWQGVPYRFGGDDRSGIDCSAFVQRVYADALNVTVPRTTEQQQRIGDRVQDDDLGFGDLVFFLTPQKTDHVGIYLGDGRFAHASSSQGVTVSNLDEDYWQDAYRTARRPASLYALAEPQRAPMQVRTDRRTGW